MEKEITHDNQYLLSPKAFHLEMPLYEEIEVSSNELSRILQLLLVNRGTVDAYCVWCDRESVFNATEYPSYSPDWISEYHPLIEVEYSCTRNDSHRYQIYYRKVASSFQKIGQFPSVADFQIPQAEKYRPILGEERYLEFTKGLGLAAHGVGIGSFVYLRRVFEGLIEDAYELGIKAKSVDSAVYLKSRMDEKIRLLNDFLPKFLVENSNLYAILSKGIHELKEQECLNYFRAVRIGVEQILDEKIRQSEEIKKGEAARLAVQSVAGEIA